MNTKGQGLDDHLEAPRRNAKNYLFAIAIDTYQHSPPLYNCVRDVERIKHILHQQYQFETDYTFTLYNQEATEKNIFNTFKRLVQTVQPEDNVLILYSGHGEYEEDIEEGYWIPVDAQLGDFSDYVSNSRIAKYIKAINAHHIFLMIDSCFSGSLFAHKNVPTAGKGLRLDTIPSRWLLTAGRNEVVSDGKPGDHSPFADNIIYFLENNQEASLSVANLINSVVNAVIYNSRQTPRGEPLQDVGHRGGQFFFHRSGVTPNYVDGDQNEPQEKDVEPQPLPDKKSKLPGFVIPTIITLAVLGMLSIGIWKLRSGPKKEPISSSRTRIEKPVERPGEGIPQEQRPSSLTEQEKPDRTPDPAISRSERAWLSAKQSNKEAVYRRFMASFPKSRRVKEAEQKIAEQYRYTLNYSPTMQAGGQLNIRFTEGAPPFHISVSNSANKKIEKVWNSKALFRMDVSALFRTESSSNFVALVVTDYNFKKVGYKLPLN